MSFSKAPLRRFNDIRASSCSPVPGPGTYHPRFYTDVAMAYNKRRISYNRGSYSTISMMSSTASSLSYSGHSASNVVLSNSSFQSRSTASPILTSKIPVSLPSKFQNKKPAVSNNQIFRFKAKSPVKNNSLRNSYSTSSLPRKGSSTLSEKVAMEMISAANESEQDNWVNTIRSLQGTVDEMQLSLSSLTDEVAEEKERSLVLEMRNQALESMVENLQCRLIQLDEIFQQTKQTDKIQELTETIENLQIAEIRLKENFAKLQQENSELGENMAAFILKIVDLLGEQNNWKAKEKEYVKNISALDDILTENQDLLFKAEERLGNLVDELENCCDYFADKLKENEETNEKFYQRQLEYEESIKRLEDKVDAADQTFTEIQTLWNKSESEYKETITTLKEKIVDLEYAFILFIFLLKKCHTIGSVSMCKQM